MVSQLTREFELRYDQLVLGQSLEAIAYSFFNSIPALYIPDKMRKPHVFENVVSQKQKNLIWKKLVFYSSLSNLIPFADLIISIKIEQEENKLTIITKNNTRVFVLYKELYLFDTTGIIGLPEAKKNSIESFQVLDWFNIIKSPKWILKNVSSDDLFVKEVVFFKKKKISKEDKIKKNIVAVSYLTKEEKELINYSENMARLKTIEMIAKNDPEHPKRKEIDLEWDKREFYPAIMPNLDGLKDNVHLMRYSVYTYEYIIKHYNNIKEDIIKIKENFFIKQRPIF